MVRELNQTLKIAKLVKEPLKVLNIKKVQLIKSIEEIKCRRIEIKGIRQKIKELKIELEKSEEEINYLLKCLKDCSEYECRQVINNEKHAIASSFISNCDEIIKNAQTDTENWLAKLKQANYKKIDIYDRIEDLKHEIQLIKANYKQ